MKIRELNLVRSRAEMKDWPEGKFLIDTVNTHSFVLAQTDADFARALMDADALLPDGSYIVKSCRWLKMKNAPQEKIAGTDLFLYEMENLERRGGTCLFMGSSEVVLQSIRERAAENYPHIRVETYSPPYKPIFSDEDNQAIIAAIREADPDLLWIGMTAPKQEKWLHAHWEQLPVHCHTGAIGAVFDFFAGTIDRAPEWWLRHDLEWLYRFLKEPRRIWRRIFVSGPRFLWLVLKEKLFPSS
ncbi:MAG: WecB/TagA/CpsF family glycosyltransferase [Selenomonadaceae bacterium]|nr:WecB/TagA/CpsF family glycosyltransferase [Selenomonadaceae bacterium]